MVAYLFNSIASVRNLALCAMYCNRAVNPPPTTSCIPVMNEASLEARNRPLIQLLVVLFECRHDLVGQEPEAPLDSFRR